ncbi:MAG: hypothetical protein GC181_11210 [Bacteroidetes bacterium]|nr:hypothetical protein [Bacteroidota bacterium]
MGRCGLFQSSFRLFHQMHKN